MIPFLSVLTFPILLILVFATLGLFLFCRWSSFVQAEKPDTGDMKVHSFYSLMMMEGKAVFAYIFVMPVVGAVFGGIHCAGWFFIFPSNDEAMLWRVCSAILTGIPFLLPVHFYLLAFLVTVDFHGLATVICVLIMLVYVVSRLLLLVEAVISLRHLTSGMLALVKWTSFIPHI